MRSESVVAAELEPPKAGVRLSIRVPTPNVSCIDLVAQLNKDTTAEEVNARLLEASRGSYKGILGYTDEPLVSVDLLGTNEATNNLEAHLGFTVFF